MWLVRTFFVKPLWHEKHGVSLAVDEVDDEPLQKIEVLKLESVSEV